MSPLMLAVAAVLLADVTTTVYALTKFSGPLHEANPAMAWLISRIGLVPALALSHVGAFALIWWRQPADWVLWALVGMFGAIAANNLRLIVKRARA